MQNEDAPASARMHQGSDVDALTQTQEIYVYQQTEASPKEQIQDAGKDISFAALDGSSGSVTIQNVAAAEASVDLANVSECIIHAAKESNLSFLCESLHRAASDGGVSLELIEWAQCRKEILEEEEKNLRALRVATQALEEELKGQSLECLTRAFDHAKEAGVQTSLLQKASKMIQKRQVKQGAEEALFAALACPRGMPSSDFEKTVDVAESAGVSSDLISHARRIGSELLERQRTQQEKDLQSKVNSVASFGNPSTGASSAPASMSDVHGSVNMAELIRAPPCEPALTSIIVTSEMPTSLIVQPTENYVSPRAYETVERHDVTPPAAHRRETIEPASTSDRLHALQTTPVSEKGEGCQQEPEAELPDEPMHSVRGSLLSGGQRTPAPRSSWEPPDMLPIYGLDADLKAKAEAKYDLSAEDQAAQWVEDITGVKVQGEFGAALRTGQVLCQLLNEIRPGTVRKINDAGMPFKERENISLFLKTCRNWGVHEYALFSTDDLYEEKNLSSVVKCIHQLGGVLRRAVPEFQGPHFGVADTSKARRDQRRDLATASQTEGLRVAMGRSHIDVVSTGNVRAPLGRGGC